MNKHKLLFLMSHQKCKCTKESSLLVYLNLPWAVVVGEILRRCNTIAFTEYCTDESCHGTLALAVGQWQTRYR